MSAEIREDWQWLMNFFGPKELAALSAPLTDEQYAMLDAFVAEHPLTVASLGEFPVFVERLAAEANR